ncbi:unnamed protein product [Effrenium voratum]|nr:unnamed protein product [Effrenium voratum]
MVRLLLVLLALGAWEGVQADKENIVKLTKFNFDDNVKRGVWFVKFYAPWCTHCQRLAPIWEKLADEAVSMDWPVKIANVDCTVSKSICEKASIKAFPTLALIHEGAFKGKYRGEATISSFKSWLAEQGVLQDGSAPAAVQPAEAAAAPREEKVREERLREEEKAPTSASTTHSAALKAILQNVVARFPTESMITNMYFYFLVAMSGVVTFYVVAFHMLEEEKEKES